MVREVPIKQTQTVNIQVRIPIPPNSVLQLVHLVLGVQALRPFLVFPKNNKSSQLMGHHRTNLGVSGGMLSLIIFDQSLNQSNTWKWGSIFHQFWIHADTYKVVGSPYTLSTIFLASF